MGAAQMLFLLGLGLVIAILMLRSRRYFRQVSRHQASPTPPPPKRKPTHPPGAPREYEQWEVAMHELARDLSSQLDSKIRVLELLIREANQAAGRLETAVKRAGGEASRAAPQLSSQPSMQPSVQPSPPRESVAARQADPPQRPATQSKSAGRPPLSLKVAGNPRFERIYALADAGLSTATIANQIGGQVGEVELILSLRGTQQPEGVADPRS